MIRSLRFVCEEAPEVVERRLCGDDDGADAARVVRAPLELGGGSGCWAFTRRDERRGRPAADDGAGAGEAATSLAEADAAVAAAAGAGAPSFLAACCWCWFPCVFVLPPDPEVSLFESSSLAPEALSRFFFCTAAADCFADSCFVFLPRALRLTAPLLRPALVPDFAALRSLRVWPFSGGWWFSVA